jgi:hypothetical protein
MRPWLRVPLLICICLLWLAGCAAPSPNQTSGEQTGANDGQPNESRATPEPAATPALATQPSGAEPPAPVDPGIPPFQPTLPGPGEGESPVPVPHQVEIEWPPRMRLQDSDTIRLALIPSHDGYVLQSEFPDHTVQGQEVQILTPEGYDLYGVAGLEGLGFQISPAGEQVQILEPGEERVWRWVLRPTQAGQNRLAVTLSLRLVPKGEPASSTQARQKTIFSRSLEVEVLTLLGLSQPQALSLGVLGVLLSSSLGVALLGQRNRPLRSWRIAQPNPELAIEPHPSLLIDKEETLALQALFRRYQRLGIDAEFLSGYSGARTFLALPIRSDGQADAPTIVKMGAAEDIIREYENYEAYVKDRLPPVTARIQHPPVRLPRKGTSLPDLAALQYTFIGLSGSRPTSLGGALRHNPDPALLWKLFESFGPHWWMQRRPYTFRLGQEYDRMLPPHYVLAPADEVRAASLRLRADQAPGSLKLAVGQRVVLDAGRSSPWQVERRAGGRSLALSGLPYGSQPALRLRWLGPQIGRRAVGQVVSDRRIRLRELTAGLTLEGLPDPLERLESLLEERVRGSRAVLHGDLNLENALVGPGGMLWLIDFAQTREGHTLYDFAHLEAELIAHVVAEQKPSPVDYLALLAGSPPAVLAPQAELLQAVYAIAARCLFDPADDREYQLARWAACLGALKFANLEVEARQLLYLSAAYIGREL